MVDLCTFLEFVVEELEEMGDAGVSPADLTEEELFPIESECPDRMRVRDKPALHVRASISKTIFQSRYEDPEKGILSHLREVIMYWKTNKTNVGSFAACSAPLTF